MAAYNVA